MSNMDQRRLELRILHLKRKISQMNNEKEGLSEVALIRRVEDAILKTQGGIDELKQWAREIDLDPGYGKLIRCPDGIRRPKLPVFESREERAAVLENRAGTASGLSEADIRRAREWRAKRDGEVSIKNMDGRSPYIPEEERGRPRGTL
jgi:hypothetical protein